MADAAERDGRTGVALRVVTCEIVKVRTEHRACARRFHVDQAVLRASDEAITELEVSIASLDRDARACADATGRYVDNAVELHLEIEKSNVLANLWTTASA